MSTTVRHPDRLAEQVNRILSNPDSWNQEIYHSDCGTKHCIAGHGQIAAGKPMSINTCRDDAREWYGLTGEDSEWLFRHDRTLTELYEFARLALAGEAYFDADGYDCNGFDRNGYCSDGYHRDGYDRDGFDRYGYNRKGCNRYGYHRKGYGRDGGSLPILKIAAGDTQ